MAETLHVVMVPWSVFGHLMPFFQFALALAKAGVHVSFISTPMNVQRLPKVPPELSSLLKIVQIPLPALDNELLPKNSRATVDVPFEKIQYLKVAYDLLQHLVKKFVADQSPDYLVIDLSVHWAVGIAKECNVPLLAFSVFSAATNVFFGPPECLVGDGQRRARPSPESLTSPPEWVTFPSQVAFREFESIGVHAGFYGGNASGISDAARVAKVLHACQAVAIGSCTELEGKYLNLFAEIIRKPVVPVGLLPPEKPENRETMDRSWVKIFQWLDEQTPKSVVFVGFGSECKLAKDQVYELSICPRAICIAVSVGSRET